MTSKNFRAKRDILPLVTAWLGGNLSYLEQLCLTSMVNLGHQVFLYTYRELDMVPDGVELRNAAEIMPEKYFSRYSNGSYALGSNLFRYKLFSKFPCIWIDTDMFLLRRIEHSEGYLFGWEDTHYINTAILSIPKESTLNSQISQLLSREPFFAPWWNSEQTEKQNAAVKNGVTIPLSELPWATSGPKLITYLAIKNGVARHAQPPEVYYPVHWKDFQMPFLNDDQINQKITKNTTGVHLWNHMLGDLKLAPKGKSFVATQCQKFGIQVHSREGN